MHHRPPADPIPWAFVKPRHARLLGRRRLGLAKRAEMSKHRTHVGVASRALRKRMSKGPGRGDTPCVKVEKNAHGFPMKPIHRSDLVRIEVAIQQGQRAVRIALEPQPCQVP